ncbi:MAG: alpha/beta fold hydrolase [Chromatiaceae bacterium]|nr:alpha/beta fold hydrolase [Chromatiaceae bacterium]
MLANLIVLSILLGSCASPPKNLDNMALDMGLTAQWLRGEEFELRAYSNRIRHPVGQLHVYLEGDGTPWITRTRVALDPTTRDPLALRLMALDPYPALYLARPCYNGTSRATACNPWLWTSGRYSEVVVASMAAALRSRIDAKAVGEVTLIGYSGGGVLAWLLARRIPEVRALITVGANLDIDRWTDRHGFSRLSGSLNPATGPPMRPGVKQWHLVGRDDENVPPEIIDALERKLGPNARVLIEPSDHHCCWLQLWPDILRRLP